MLDLLKEDHGSKENALAAVDQAKAEYVATYPEAASQYDAEIDQAVETAREMVDRLIFDEPGVTWEDFPDHNKHKDFAGCFRCHNSRMQTEEGESIRLHCNICHSVPETVIGDARPPQMPLSYIQEPESHLETNFVADHRFQASDECATCHGEIEFGDDDSSFCANSSCHGRAWPEVELDAAFTHPIELEGKHAEVWCHDCHAGVESPEYNCANCHEPPTDPHFGAVCEDCHSPQGWDQADMGDFEHPVPLEGAHAQASCSDCHVAGAEIASDCAACHQPPSDDHFGPNCQDCHTPTAFADATLPADLHPIPLVGAHSEAACESCHASGQDVPAYECANCHTPPENHLPGDCQACHSPEGWAASAASLTSTAPEIEHEVEGREDCMMCHSPDGQMLPAPSNHVEYSNDQCTLCHKAGS
jgi:hypothetical protein